jgi:acetyltransferase-like isoleucine patch superfamily enzyme
MNFAKNIYARDPFRKKLKIHNRGSILIKKWVVGRNNVLNIGNRACLNKVIIKIQGSNNKIYIGDNTFIGKNTRLYIFGNNLELYIGKNCTINHDDELLVQEDNSKIYIGDDCMLSHHINLRTSDAHPIYDAVTGKRSNPAADIRIGNHVWIGANVIVQKGVSIGDGCVIGTYSVVNRKISNPSMANGETDSLPVNSCIAGIPAKVVKQNIRWEREFKTNIMDQLVNG